MDFAFGCVDGGSSSPAAPGAPDVADRLRFINAAADVWLLLTPSSAQGEEPSPPEPSPAVPLRTSCSRGPAEPTTSTDCECDFHFDLSRFLVLLPSLDMEAACFQWLSSRRLDRLASGGIPGDDMEWPKAGGVAAADADEDEVGTGGLVQEDDGREDEVMLEEAATAFALRCSTAAAMMSLVAARLPIGEAPP